MYKVQLSLSLIKCYIIQIFHPFSTLVMTCLRLFVPWILSRWLRKSQQERTELNKPLNVHQKFFPRERSNAKVRSVIESDFDMNSILDRFCIPFFIYFGLILYLCPWGSGNVGMSSRGQFGHHQCMQGRGYKRSTYKCHQSYHSERVSYYDLLVYYRVFSDNTNVYLI